jgi:glucosamine--fructose-6-phosphate aminotransferase (isomerizing)
MQKEIFEQPRRRRQHAGDGDRRAAPVGVACSAADADAGVRATPGQVLILACGTSCHSGVVAQLLAGVDREDPLCDVEIASEYRYRESVPDARDTLVVTISQSGETADTLAALQHAKRWA